MSADNWAVCPRCKKQHDEAAALETKRIAELYGKLPSHEWIAEMNKQIKPFDEHTFREDYEIGVKGIDLVVSYSGKCNVCGLKAELRTRDKLAI